MMMVGTNSGSRTDSVCLEIEVDPFSPVLV